MPQRPQLSNPRLHPLGSSGQSLAVKLNIGAFEAILPWQPAYVLFDMGNPDETVSLGRALPGGVKLAAVGRVARREGGWKTQCRGTEQGKWSTLQASAGGTT